MQRTELASLVHAYPCRWYQVTVCAAGPKLCAILKDIGFISLSDGSCYNPSRLFFLG